MKIISHRGNLSGRLPEQENHPDYILGVVRAGYDVEVDVWCIGEKFVLGHDLPQYEVSASWLKDLPLWCHAKNSDALEGMLVQGIHCFWHQQDFCTLTSRGIPWCYPGNWIRGGITVVMDSYHPAIVIPDGVLGVCVDDPIEWNRR